MLIGGVHGRCKGYRSWGRGQGLVVSGNDSGGGEGYERRSEMP